MKWNDKPYYSIDTYLKNRYGEKIYKIALDGGMTCPNRDGTLDTRGCIFCSAGGSGEYAAPCTTSISEQLQEGLRLFGDKKTGNHYIAYFQSYTNTYAPVDYLRKIYTEALECENVVGISIATRPDCISDEILLLLDELASLYAPQFIWIELGLQTIHNTTAQYIRRGYDLECFNQTAERLKIHQIPFIVHVILGLPGETPDMMLSTIQYLNHCGLFGIKIHMLHIIQGTDLAKELSSLTLPDQQTYIDLVIACLEHLRPEITIHRLTGDGPRNATLAPLWSLNKRGVLNALHREMKERNTWQGKKVTESYECTNSSYSL